MDFEREQLAFFVVKFSFGVWKLQSSWPKTFCWKLLSLRKYHFWFFLFCQRLRLNKNFWRFLDKISWVVKTAFYLPTATFFWELKISEKICFLSFWDMGQKILAFSQIFSAVVSKLQFTCPYDFFHIFFRKTHNFFRLSDIWKNKLQIFLMISLAGFSNFQFHVSTGTFGGKKVENFEFFLSVSKIEPYIFGLLTKLFLRGSQYCFLLARTKTVMEK